MPYVSGTEWREVREVTESVKKRGRGWGGGSVGFSSEMGNCWRVLNREV